MTDRKVTVNEWWSSMTDDERDAHYASAISGSPDNYEYLDDDDGPSSKSVTSHKEFR